MSNPAWGLKRKKHEKRYYIDNEKTFIPWFLNAHHLSRGTITPARFENFLGGDRGAVDHSVKNGVTIRARVSNRHKTAMEYSVYTFV